MNWRVVMLGLCWFLASGVAVSESRPWILSPNGLGPIQIRMPMEQAIGFAKGVGEVKETTVMAEGESQRQYDVMQGGKRLFSIEPARGGVDRITVWSATYRDVKGMGVGSTLAELKKVYPAITVNPGEGFTCAFLSQGHSGNSFCFAGMKPGPSTPVHHVYIYSVDDL